MKEVIARSILAVVGFLLGYLLMAFAVGNLNVTEWTIEQRGSVSIGEGFLIIMISTFPIKLTK